MHIKKETPEDLREKIKKEEMKSDPAGNLNDATNRARNGVPGDPGSSGWKETGVVILVLVVGYIVYSVFFR